MGAAHRTGPVGGSKEAQSEEEPGNDRKRPRSGAVALLAGEGARRDFNSANQVTNDHAK